MKKLFFIWVCLFLQITEVCAQTFSFVHNGNDRTYIVHVPPGYSSDKLYPMVLNFHGYTSNGRQQQSYSLMDVVADTAGFITVYPNGIGNAWNVGFGISAYYTGIDDVGFVNALIDTMMSDYSIDSNRIYATGMSNGGYLSNRLACELPNRIAAIASVTGPMTDSTRVYCNPPRKVPVMHIHGTGDPIVNYEGMPQSLSATGLIDFWKKYDECTVSSTDVPYQDIKTTDHCTALRKNYVSCSDGAEVVLIEITGGGHTWPGGAIDLALFGNTNRDFSASGEIWNFFKKFTLNQFSGTETHENKWINVHPNPVHHDLYISPGLTYSIYNNKGKMFLEGISANEPIDVRHLPLGMYFVHLKTEKQIIVRKIMKV